MGVSYLKGALSKCIPKPNLDLDVPISKIITKQDCLDNNGIWKNEDVKPVPPWEWRKIKRLEK